MHCEKGHPRKMGEGDDKSTLTGNEPLSGSNIGGETTFFPLTVLPFLRACPSFVCRPSSGEMCCSVCMGGGGSAITRTGDRVHQSRAGAWMLSPRNHSILHQKENPANISCLAEVSGTRNNSIT